ncbi:hypothetical protein PLICRDRAFT_110757 [Plicaturopsis crispa FD-325 SS-3]|nr:hypothetical protein PLICRDRAFT_110757 [Plicaturopsis crispa FD-325 SS-3]
MAVESHNSNIELNITQTVEHDRYDREEQGLASEVGVPSLFGIPLKYISLVTLAVQNSLLTIIMHYSRVSTPPSRAYSAATAVLMNELLKGSISLAIAFTRIEPFPMEVFSADCWKLSIPAILYVIQNNLQFVAASNLEAATFQVSYQMKILTTAAFSVLLLRKKLSPAQWLALVCLALGVGIVQIQSSSTSATNTNHGADVHSMVPLKGFMAVIAACFTSGLAGVYFEMVLKGSQADLWVRNVQLSVFSLLPALVPVIFSQSSSAGSVWALFHNFGAWAWATVFVQVLGGLVTAMVIKYSDNILKGFATSLSIVISFLASVALFDFQMTFTFILGSVIVLIATWLYNQPSKGGASSGWESKGWTLSWSEKARVPGRLSPELPGIAISSSTRSLSTSSLSSVTAVSVEREPMLGLGLPEDADDLKKGRVVSASSSYSSLNGMR